MPARIVVPMHSVLHWWVVFERWLACRSLGRATFIALLGGYVVGWIVSPLVVPYGPTDLDLFFWPAAQWAAAGHLLTVYTVHGLDAYPNANGPLGLLPLVPLARLDELLGLPNTAPVNAAVVNVVGALGALLMTREALLLIRDERGRVELRLAASAMFLLAPAFIIAAGDYGHVEQPLELWFVLLGVRWWIEGRSLGTGVMLGLAVLTRTTALTELIPFLLLSLAARRWRPMSRVASGVAGTLAIGLAPFLIADSRDVVHSLITYRGDLAVGVGSVWMLAVGGSLSGVAQHADVYVVAAVVVIVCGGLVALRPGFASSRSGVISLVAIASLVFPMLSKTVFPYYFVEPCMLCILWWLARCGPLLSWRALVPVAVVAGTFLARWGVTHPPGTAGLVEGVLSSVLLAACAGLIAADFLQRAAAASSGRAIVEQAPVIRSVA